MGRRVFSLSFLYRSQFKKSEEIIFRNRLADIGRVIYRGTMGNYGELGNFTSITRRVTVSGSTEKAVKSARDELEFITANLAAAKGWSWVVY